MGPRYNPKYQTAAENALHSSYRSCLQVLKENNLTTIGFSPIHSEWRGYPPENGAHISISMYTHNIFTYFEYYYSIHSYDLFLSFLLFLRSSFLFYYSLSLFVRYYPHIHISLGTVRRFLEKHGEGLAAVVFCFDRVVSTPPHFLHF